ncbi:CPBP family intramembrane glutamic endopeptidase [Solitalea lacus]|uniref:CPBP family intramembrane glutamic endopeptidase n=1 Tax=Solitalea lacus TaxID=2911172 RepID=UPI001EDB89A1|nr:type II CAAX endopeptidase family protein [Solitalea lacus]UKJ07466.1 CPBP family intramembrane metalloprotease [Solitalea lacus]
MNQKLPQRIASLWLFFLVYISASIITAAPIIALSFIFDFDNIVLLALASIPANLIVIFYYTRNRFSSAFSGAFASNSINYSAANVGLILLVTLCCIVLLDPVQAFLPLNDWGREETKELLSKPLWGFLLACIAAPVLEEIIFRGIVLKGLLQSNSPVKAIVISALLFGIIHFNPPQSIQAFLLALLIGWIYYRTGDLSLCILVHFINNALSFSLFQITSLKDFDTLYSILNNNTLYFSIELTTLLLFIGGLISLNKLFRLSNNLASNPVTAL